MHSAPGNGRSSAMPQCHFTTRATVHTLTPALFTVLKIPRFHATSPWFYLNYSILKYPFIHLYAAPQRVAHAMISSADVWCLLLIFYAYDITILLALWDYSCFCKSRLRYTLHYSRLLFICSWHDAISYYAIRGDVTDGARRAFARYALIIQMPIWLLSLRLSIFQI